MRWYWQKKRQIDQCNRTVSSQIYPHKDSQMPSYKEAKAINSAKAESSTNDVGITG